MTPVPEEIIHSAIAIIGNPDTGEERIEEEVRALVADDMTARRLIDWIPEAFGMVLVSHLSGGIVLPKTFSARTAAGKWIQLPFSREPIFMAALRMAQEIYHNGPREIFKKVSISSATLNTVNNALNSGSSLDGAVMSGPALIGIPAEVYTGPHKPFWRRLFGG